MLGSALGQAIALALSFIVTRIYAPDEFASLEQFAMILGILGAVAGGKYELAIMLPDSKEKALRILRSTVRIAFLVSTVAGVLFFLFGDVIAGFLKNPDIKNMLWLLGPALFFFMLTQALNYWHSRNNNFGVTASSKTLFSTVSEPSKIGLGKIGLVPDGLIYGVLMGHLASAGLMVAKLKDVGLKNLYATVDYDDKDHLLEYKNYPLYVMPGSLLNRLAQWVHIALFGFLFGDAGLMAVGFLGLSRRIIMQPLNILSTSFAQVYYQRLTEKSGSALKSFYFKMLAIFTGISVFIIAIVWVLPDESISFLFGEEWIGIMAYLRILVFWFTANFTVGSLAFILHRLQKQKMMFWLDLIHFILVAFSMLFAFIIEYEILEVLMVFVAAKVLYLLLNIIMTIKALNEPIQA